MHKLMYHKNCEYQKIDMRFWTAAEKFGIIFVTLILKSSLGHIKYVKMDYFLERLGTLKWILNYFTEDLDAGNLFDT